ncbi:hypothetical protein CGRA01v4_11841 [Colletotrichum graminicola]|nr:hypothetical protein CGRA01v4_11841 [Colletotrichum graminicola]
MMEARSDWNASRTTACLWSGSPGLTRRLRGQTWHPHTHAEALGGNTELR